MSTQDNLQDAFAGESQANRKYLAFAKKADDEGFNQAAKLFRAAAAAETESFPEPVDRFVRKAPAIPASPIWNFQNRLFRRALSTNPIPVWDSAWVAIPVVTVTSAPV